METKRDTMTFKAFFKRAEGVTGDGDYQDMLFSSYLTGPQGARFELFKEKQHGPEAIAKAKAYLKRNFDVVQIYIIEST